MKRELQGFSKVSRTPQYVQCYETFERHGGWGILVEQAVRQMLIDLNSFDKVDRFLNGEQIGYKYLDGISYKLRYGYKTLFAYFQERENRRITPERLNEEIAIELRCGSFSYAEIPKGYDCVCGVTGTLETLSEPEKELLENEYQIEKHSYMPSVYYGGKESKLIFYPDGSDEHNSDVQILQSLEEFHGFLFQEIQDRLKSLTTTRELGNYSRAVLVFFESTPKLELFYKSRALDPIKESVKLMTEETPSNMKEGLIRQAVTSGSITLLSRLFGRGTDFICYDDSLIEAGGVHVISTFVSAEKSEEVLFALFIYLFRHDMMMSLFCFNRSYS